jgi:hypothetical protein
MKKFWFVIAAAIPLVVVGSVAVWMLSDGGARRQGALVAPSDPVSMAWRGGWSERTTYAVGEVVSAGDATYLAAKKNIAVDPTSECASDCSWTLLAEPTRAHMAYIDGSVALTDTATKMMSNAVPGGTYLAAAKVTVYNSSASAAAVVQCSFSAQGYQFETASTTVQPSGYATLVVLSPASLSPPGGAINSYCRRLSGAGTPSVTGRRMMVVKADLTNDSG